jgi:hypothetical protein
MFAVNILGPRGGIKETFKFDNEQAAVKKQYELEDDKYYVEFVNLAYFPKRQK